MTDPEAGTPAVVGLASYPTPDAVRVFLGSFAEHRRDSRLYLLVDRRRLAAWKAVESPHVRLLPMRPPCLSELGPTSLLRRALHRRRAGWALRALDRALLAAGRLPIAPLFDSATVWRLRYEARVVRRRAARARWIFLTDVRDLAFQGDFEPLFDRLCAAAPLHVFEEIDCLGSEADQAGAPAIAVLADGFVHREGRPILCAGTVLGTPAAMTEYLRRMLEVLAIEPARHPRMLDQGALNLLYYTGRLDDLSTVAHRLGEGGVATLALAKRHPDLQVDEAGAAWRGRRPVVVHQYDRVPALRRVYEARYGDPVAASPASY